MTGNESCPLLLFVAFALVAGILALSLDRLDQAREAGVGTTSPRRSRSSLNRLVRGLLAPATSVLLEQPLHVLRLHESD